MADVPLGLRPRPAPPSGYALPPIPPNQAPDLLEFLQAVLDAMTRLETVRNELLRVIGQVGEVESVPGELDQLGRGLSSVGTVTSDLENRVRALEVIPGDLAVVEERVTTIEEYIKLVHPDFEPYTP